MKCKKCGKTIRNGQQVCPYCSAKQPPERVSLAQASNKKKPLTKKQRLIRIGIIAGAVLLALILTVVSLVLGLLGKVERGSELSGDIGINSDLPTEGVQNIALFGLDTRSKNDSGRSDAIIILSIDRTHNMIKMTSLARDTFVYAEGHGYMKLTHAWAHGKVNLAVKTINQSFGMNISDYVYVNFYELVDIIDYIGGVDIDVDENEKQVMNNKYAPELKRLGFNYVPITQTGMQHLSGAQALAYSRNRYTGSDITRGNRQKEVLQAMYAQVRETPMTKFPTLVSKILSMCHTNLTNGEMLGIGTWAATKSPEFAVMSLPTSACNVDGSDHHDGYGWVFRYDLKKAAQLLYEFIYETEAGDISVVQPSTAPRRTAAPTKATTAAVPYTAAPTTARTTAPSSPATTSPTTAPPITLPMDDFSEPTTATTVPSETPDPDQ